ncbi:MAG: ABC transporter ATP-binding protein, partial [Spirochaetes bacterium]|nr:ABC transporter ATP-binding protein [Spirochaetota bacterium]
MEKFLEVKNLYKKYNSKKTEIVAVNYISFDGYKGEILGLLGPNGSGKTTTVKSIANIIEYDSGEILIRGYNNKKNGIKVKEMMGAVLEGARNIFWRLTPVENMIYFAGLKGFSKKQIKNNIDFLVETLNLKNYLTIEAGKLSKGNQQKVAIACAFITDPEIVLLDEPTLGLDVETCREMYVWIKNIIKEKNNFILVTSHDMKFIENVCDRVAVIKNGKLLILDTVDNLKKYFIKKIYKIVFSEPLKDQVITKLENQFSIRTEISDNGDFSVYLTTNDDSILYYFFGLLQEDKKQIKSLNILNDDFDDVFLEIIK